MGGHERTEDGHHLIINGRKWRASDPAIPEPLRQELVTELMTARRLIKSRGDEGRFRAHDAKVALGERGEPWWETSKDGQRERLGAAVRALLRKREGSTICPSDAARIVGGENWRELMPLAREVAGDLAGTEEVRITQRGDEVSADASGPIRLAPGPALQH
ncbi:DUF3253 domain-containing protein [Bogoriella caseilytica]|uniref:Uncharacterized protein DUF3253 n=1 Tax=Bogoriella caseilytica TaxID=56055 RepID=A0A3N2BBH6_9MICO|nr:DUF3253 domain-containing protein [Bogoriella caseilytica]ROR72611.1 uncharacterized protein DUF3253 [Bogoriella caseilytica]